jgi:hypothetical protein
MALKKIELPDELLAKLGATKSPKELGEIVESYVVAGMECVDFSKDNIMLYNVILDLAIRLGKEQEINTMVKEALKEINQKILSEL